jgi:phage gpG-like protein
MTLVRGLRQAKHQLAIVDIPAVATCALEAAAQDLEAKVRDLLSQTPGQDHSVPWLRTGTLRASIGHNTDGNVAVVGSTSDIAVDQELGTRTNSPRSFLAATASAEADGVIALIVNALAQSLADRT